MSDPAEVARRFADALDRSDFEATARLLDADCVYDIGDDTHIGPAPIIASYRDNDTWAREHLDAIEYGSAIKDTGPRTATITFTDHIHHADRKHLHTCEQHITINDAGLIERIEHHDLPGEREAVDAFFVAVNVKRAT